MPKLLRFASTPPLQRHSRKAPDCRPGSGARNTVARYLRDLRGREDRQDGAGEVAPPLGLGLNGVLGGDVIGKVGECLRQFLVLLREFLIPFRYGVRLAPSVDSPHGFNVGILGSRVGIEYGHRSCYLGIEFVNKLVHAASLGKWELIALRKFHAQVRADTES